MWVRNGKRVEKSAADSMKLDPQRQLKESIFAKFIMGRVVCSRLKSGRTPC